MKEHQRAEWKESWRDEFLKILCAFANAEGGVLVVGRNDRGEAVGVKNARKLLVDVPNKVRDYKDDRLSIWNPGELPEGWSLEKFLKQHSSRPFNPSVANAFFRAGDIEAWGRGIHQIFAACREAETPKPRVLYEPGDMWFEFPYSAAYLGIIPSGAGRRGLEERVGEKVGEKGRGKRSGKKLTANQQRILELLFQHPKMAAPELAEIVGISERKIEQNIATRMGGLKRIGPAKGGHWEVLK
jgi:ATP-dependent DNA helicase RecG